MIRPTKDGYELIDKDGSVVAYARCLASINAARRLLADTPDPEVGCGVYIEHIPAGRFPLPHQRPRVR